MGERLKILETNWAPATRLLAGAAGGALLGYGFTLRFPIACILGTAGIGLMARAMTNTEMKRMIGLAGSRCAVQGNAADMAGGERQEPSPASQARNQPFRRVRKAWPR